MPISAALGPNLSGRWRRRLDLDQPGGAAEPARDQGLRRVMSGRFRETP
jgi:hypothetical protein